MLYKMEKGKKIHDFLNIEYSKIKSIFLEHFVERKPLISEEWVTTIYFPEFSPSYRIGIELWCGDDGRCTNCAIYFQMIFDHR